MKDTLSALLFFFILVFFAVLIVVTAAFPVILSVHYSNWIYCFLYLVIWPPIFLEIFLGFALLKFLDAIGWV